MRARLAAAAIGIVLGLLPLPTLLPGLASQGVVAAAASSSSPIPLTSHILLNLPGETSAGQDIHIQATLLQSDGQPVVAAYLNLFIAGRFAAKSLTDSSGTADFLLLGKFPPGRYYATVSYFGDIPGPSTTTGTFDVTPDTLIVSVPKFIPAGQKVVITATLLRDGQPIPGIKVHFTANGVKKHATRTDGKGVARWVFVDDFPPGAYNLKIEARVYRGKNGSRRFMSATDDASFTVAPDGISLVLPPDGVAIGARIPVNAILASQGQPIPGATLHLLINGRDVRQGRTDAFGIAHFILKGDLAEGRYPITVTYPAHHRRGRPAIGTFADASGVLQIRPLALAIQTVPAVPNVAFVLDGKTVFASDSQGVARIAVAVPGGHTLAIRIASPDAQTRMEFSRWGDDHFAKSRPLDIRQDTTFYAGLRLAYLSQVRFVDLQGNLLKNSRISNVVITGPDAEIIKLSPPYLPIWLWTPAPVKRTGEPGLYVTAAPYAVASADFDGLSVVDRGRQQFAVCLVACVANKTWSIPLQLYRLDIHAEDALLHFSLQRSVVVTNPIGKKITVKLDRHGDARLDDLARGLYSVHVLASGISASVPVALSKSQPVDIPVISIPDLLIGLGLNLFAVSGLFMLGRRRAWLVRMWTLRRPAWGASHA